MTIPFVVACGLMLYVDTVLSTWTPPTTIAKHGGTDQRDQVSAGSPFMLLHKPIRDYGLLIKATEAVRASRDSTSRTKWEWPSPVVPDKAIPTTSKRTHQKSVGKPADRHPGGQQVTQSGYIEQLNPLTNNKNLLDPNIIRPRSCNGCEQCYATGYSSGYSSGLQEGTSYAYAYADVEQVNRSGQPERFSEGWSDGFDKGFKDSYFSERFHKPLR